MKPSYWAPNPLSSTQRELYDWSVQHCQAFLRFNNLPLPTYLTYAEAFAMPADSRTFRMLHKLCDGPTQGYGTGWYHNNHVFVNLPRCAKPVSNPFANRRSYPGNKTDRTPTGVVAHETGHHVEAALVGRRWPRVQVWMNPKILGLTGEHGEKWRQVIKKSKAISGYEPVPSESWAETMRLFILNPDLLRLAVPERYAFITKDAGLRPLVQDDFRSVLNQHPAYIANAESWISKTK